MTMHGHMHFFIPKKSKGEPFTRLAYDDEAAKRGTRLHIFEFTNDMKAVFGDSDDPEDYRGEMSAVRPATTRDQACRHLLLRERVIDWYGEKAIEQRQREEEGTA